MTRPTITDVANVAGVSKGTVSRVLNDHSKVSDSARAAVHDAIEQLGYRTNVHARSLATGLNDAIALIIADARDQLFRDPTFFELIEGVRDGLAGTKTNLVLLMGGTEAEDRRTVAYLDAGHVDGLIHLNPYLDDPITEGLAGSPLPIVFCGPRPPLALPGRNWMVTIQDREGVLQALAHLDAQGAETIAMIGGHPRGVSAEVRHDAYREWLGDRYDAELYEPGDYSSESGRDALKRLLDRRPDIDAVFCASDRMARGALEAIRNRGLAVPDDLLVMGFDDQRLAAGTKPALSTIHQPIRQVGRTAIATLMAALSGASPPDTVLPTTLVVRDSTGVKTEKSRSTTTPRM